MTIQRLNPQFYANTYAIIATLLALYLLFTHQPFRSAHEWQHFYQGLSFSSLYKDETFPANVLRFRKMVYKRPTAADATLLCTYRTSLSEHLLPIQPTAVYLELDKQTRKHFTSNPNVAAYNFTNYIPQIITGTIGDLFELRPFTIYFLTRLIILSFAVISGYAVLRMLPCLHLPALVMLFLPVWWTTRTIQYIDQTVNIAALFYVMLILRVIYQHTKISTMQILLILLTGLILSAGKVVYFPLVLAIFLIPEGNFLSIRQRYFYLLMISSLCILASLASAVYATKKFHHISIQQVQETINLEQSADLNTQDKIKMENNQWLKKNAYWKNKETDHTYMYGNREAMTRTLQNPFESLSKVTKKYSMLKYWQRVKRIKGMFFHYAERDGKILRSYKLYPYLLVLLTFFCSPVLRKVTSPPNIQNYVYVPTIKARLFLLSLIITTLFLIGLSMLVTNSGVEGVQGRYYLPLLPFIALMCTMPMNNRWYTVIISFQFIVSMGILFILYLYLFKFL